MAGRTIIRTIAAILLWCALPFAAEAHLMPPQRGTINILNDGAFVVLSIPVSAFKGIDDNNDGRLSVTELSAHYTEVETAISQRLQLSDDRGPRPMLGLMLKLSPDDDAPGAPSPQIVMLGRFGLDGYDRPLRLNIDLFGIDKTTRTISIRAARRDEAQLLVFSPDKPSLALFAPAYAVFGDYVQIGAEHILLGFDHLLFLLVILACGWSWNTRRN